MRSQVSSRSSMQRSHHRFSRAGPTKTGYLAKAIGGSYDALPNDDCHLEYLIFSSLF
jgi:hypothetical protein